jgi:hypothetical protein
MGRPARQDATEAAAPDDEGTGLPGLTTWRAVYAIVIVLSFIWVASLTVLTFVWS